MGARQNKNLKGLFCSLFMLISSFCCHVFEYAFNFLYFLNLTIILLVF